MNSTDGGVPLLYDGTSTFGLFHSLAIGSIITSFVLTIIILILSFKINGFRLFYSKWTRGQRFCLYVTVCDCFFSFWHFFDHFLMLINEDHVKPNGLCEFLAFLVIFSLTSKYLLVLHTALLTFISVYFMTEIELGKKDWKFLSASFGCPLLTGCALWSLGVLGPAGYACFIKNPQITTYVSIIPNIIISFSITFFYLLTWIVVFIRKRYYVRTNQWTEHRQDLILAARKMIMSVSIFLLQFLPGVSVIIMQLYEQPPFPVFMFSVIIINLGGVYDLLIFILQRKKTGQVAPTVASQ